MSNGVKVNKQTRLEISKKGRRTNANQLMNTVRGGYGRMDGS